MSPERIAREGALVVWQEDAGPDACGEPPLGLVEEIRDRSITPMDPILVNDQGVHFCRAGLLPR